MVRDSVDPPKMPKVKLLERDLHLLKKFLEKMEIRLLHATRPENLTSILQHGLIPISHSKFSGLVDSKTNDGARALHGANCLSIGWPNTKTLATWGPIGTFALIEIDRAILLKKPWFSFPTNSSSKECVEAFAENPLAFCGIEALANLFVDSTKTNHGRELKRQELGTPRGLPNDPQAEVVIDEEIEPWWFTNITFPTAAALQRYAGAAIERRVESVICDPKAFAPRFDSTTWTRGERVGLADWQRRRV